MIKKMILAGVVLICFCKGLASASLLPDIFMKHYGMSFSPDTIEPSQMLTVNWRDNANSTVGIPESPPPPQFSPAYGPWQDAIFLSENSSWDTGDILIGTNTFDGTLNAGQSHDFSETFQIPFDIVPGNYKIIVYADYFGDLQEDDETNNWDVCSETLTIIPEPATLLLLSLGGLFLRRNRRFR